MAATQDREDDAPAAGEGVAAFQSSPDKTVFTESDNPDGWISTDRTVDIER
ncbi:MULTISPECIES: hypothetical protein [Halobacterium]|uniref:DUF7331 family protein n=1 Tax=Halobacterium TaxID=2239 RepID=UPI000AF7F36B|nr:MULTISPECIES: hypothetical protein [Halobacterium]MCG1004458.1 hypothetical protein [Halobacterium noricense]